MGVASYDNQSFLIADIPGLIEGASQGKGLGFDFLRHVERTRMLVHVIDIASVDGRDPFEDFVIINNELKNYSKSLSKVPQIIVLNKIDLLNGDYTIIEEFKRKYEKDYKIVSIKVVPEGVDVVDAQQSLCAILIDKATKTTKIQMFKDFYHLPKSLSELNLTDIKSFSEDIEEP